VLIGEQEETLAAVPNLVLAELRVEDDVKTATTPLLRVDEFVARAEPGAPAATAPAFAELGAEVCARVKAENLALRSAEYRPLSRCKLVEPFDSVTPLCAFHTQHLTCGDADVNYSRQRLSFRGRSLSRSFARPGWAPKPLVTESFGTVPLRECFAQAFFAPEGGLFVGELYQACQAGGDWCSVPSVWHVVKP
jgi:hypothetical protein